MNRGDPTRDIVGTSARLSHSSAGPALAGAHALPLRDRRHIIATAHEGETHDRVPPSSFHSAHVRRALVAAGLSLVLTASFARVGTQNLHRLMQVALVLVAGASVAIADSLIKRSARADTLWSALRSPTMLLAICLYLTQIVLVTYVFLKQWNLGVAGLMQMSVYAVVVIFVGITFFQEKVTRMEEIGMAFAFIGAILMNF